MGELFADGDRFVSGFESDRTDPSTYDRPAAEWLLEHLECGVLLVQGPMGSLLQSQVGAADIPAAYWNIAERAEVERIHRLYRLLGADIAITNTFQASGPALARDAIPESVERVNRAAVFCARRAAAPCTLGSMGPCGVEWTLAGDAGHAEAVGAYREQARSLLEAGASGILLETFCSMRDVVPALDGVGSVLYGMPLLVSFAVDDDCSLLGDGLSIEAACLEALHAGACAVGVNCCSIPAATESVRRLVRLTDRPIMVRPHAGMPRRTDEGELMWDENPAAFAEACELWCADGARIVGACCGAGPRTLSAMAEVIEDGRAAS
ncbi:MAG: homocysteine S-methyltransferase family protein [Collinsella sp.]|nr:homocysteine S-methyltransferase family protein [Collinsella sp.]